MALATWVAATLAKAEGQFLLLSFVCKASLDLLVIWEEAHQAT